MLSICVTFMLRYRKFKCCIIIYVNCVCVCNAYVLYFSHSRHCKTTTIAAAVADLGHCCVLLNYCWHFSWSANKCGKTKKRHYMVPSRLPIAADSWNEQCSRSVSFFLFPSKIKSCFKQSFLNMLNEECICRHFLMC